MASSKQDQPLLQKISQRHLECQICKDRFKEPKILTCSHSFCLECLRHLVEEQNPPTRSLSCPMCRGQTLLTGEGVADLQTDFKLTSLLEEIEQHESDLRSQQEMELPSQGSVSKCRKHTDKEVIMYCDTCKQLVCTTCIAKTHRKHFVIELNDALDKCKKKANKLFAEVDQLHTDFKIASKDIATSRMTLDSVVAAIKGKISKKANEEVARIRKEEHKLMMEVQQIYDDRAKMMKNADATNNIKITTVLKKKDNVNHLMDTENCCEILHLVEKLFQDLNKYTEIQPTKMSPELTNVAFEDDQKSLGQLVAANSHELNAASAAGFSAALAVGSSAAPSAASAAARQFRPERTQKKWMLKTEIKNYQNRAKQKKQFSPCDVAVYSNGDIVVADFESPSLIQILAESSKALPQATSIKDLNYPSRVVVNRNDELIGVDYEAIKIFNSNHELLRQFVPRRGSGSEPSCIVVDDNNQIAVGYRNKAEISLHKPDGALNKTLSAPGIGRYLTTYKQKLIYTNCDNKKLMLIDSNGVVSSRDVHQSKWPHGVCCDKDGTIYIAVGSPRSPSSPGEIQHYSPEGNYIRSVIRVHECPHRITLTPSGDLVVTTEESVLIYTYHHELTT